VNWRTCRWGMLTACEIAHGHWQNGGARHLGTGFYHRFTCRQRCVVTHLATPRLTAASSFFVPSPRNLILPS
jgi:hypothetical protein